MDAMTALQTRVSVPRLGGMAPDRDVRDEMYKAALRAPDHAQLKPWRFLEIEGDALSKLGDLFAQAVVEDTNGAQVSTESVAGVLEAEVLDDISSKDHSDQSANATYEQTLIRKVEKARAKPLRAPLIIVVIASPQIHPKVPEIEQLLSAGCAAQNILLACHALGVGVVWRTGSMAFHKTVKQGLGLSSSEHIIGFLYMGQPTGNIREVPKMVVEDFVKSWPAPK